MGGERGRSGKRVLSSNFIILIRFVPLFFDFQKYLSDFKSHDLASLERFKNLTEGDLDSLEITNLEHRVKLLTVAKLLLEPIKGKWCVYLKI